MVSRSSQERVSRDMRAGHREGKDIQARERRPVISSHGPQKPAAGGDTAVGAVHEAQCHSDAEDRSGSTAACGSENHFGKGALGCGGQEAIEICDAEEHHEDEHDPAVSLSAMRVECLSGFTFT
jgi:hypothetical protein